MSKVETAHVNTDEIIESFIERFLSGNRVSFSNISTYLEKQFRELKDGDLFKRLYSVILKKVEQVSLFPNDLIYLSLEPLRYFEMYEMEYAFLNKVFRDNISDSDLPAWFCFDYGVCLFHLGKWAEARIMLYHASFDDEEYKDDVSDYLERINKIEDI